MMYNGLKPAIRLMKWHETDFCGAHSFLVKPYYSWLVSKRRIQDQPLAHFFGGIFEKRPLCVAEIGRETAD